MTEEQLMRVKKEANGDISDESGLKLSNVESERVEKKEQQSPTSQVKSLLFLSDMVESSKKGNLCARVVSVSASLRSHSGWQYRKMRVSDRSLEADLLIAESKFSSWNFRAGDHIACSAKSNGIDNEGNLSLFFDDFLGPFDTAKLLYEASEQVYELKSKSPSRMKSNETVYQISAREAKSLLELIRLWISEGKPQHYTKWCQMHQIVATNLFYMGLVKRTASMSGYYYPTHEALEFFAGRRMFPKKRVFVRDSEGKHVLISDDKDEENRSFTDYLNDRSDSVSALNDYKEALSAYQDRIKAILEQNPV